MHTISKVFEGPSRKCLSEIDIVVNTTGITKNILKYEFDIHMKSIAIRL